MNPKAMRKCVAIMKLKLKDLNIVLVRNFTINWSENEELSFFTKVFGQQQALCEQKKMILKYLQ